MFISPFADIFTGLTSRHEGSASACRAAFRPNLVVVSLEEPYLMLRFPQLGFGFEALALGFLQRCELLFGGFDTKFRSEEHTSELQSLMRISYAVFCLKKKKQ